MFSATYLSRGSFYKPQQADKNWVNLNLEINYSFSSFFLGTLLELLAEIFLLFGNHYLKNSTTRLYSVPSSLGQTLEPVMGTQEVPWSKMMVKK